MLSELPRLQAECELWWTVRRVAVLPTTSNNKVRAADQASMETKYEETNCVDHTLDMWASL